MLRVPQKLENLGQQGIASCTGFTSIFFRQTSTGEGSAVLTPHMAIVGKLKELIPDGDAEMAFSDGRNFKGPFVNGEIIGMCCFSWLKNRIKSIKRIVGLRYSKCLELSIVDDSTDSEYYMRHTTLGGYLTVKNNKRMEYLDSEEWERYDVNSGIWTLNLPAREQMIFTFPNKSIAVVDKNTGIGTFLDRTGTYKIDISLSMKDSSNPRLLFSKGKLLPSNSPMIYKDHLGTLYYLTNAEGVSIDNLKVSRVVFRTGATIEGDFIAGHRWRYKASDDYEWIDNELQISLLSGKGTLVEDGLKFEFSVESNEELSVRIIGNGQITSTMLKWLVHPSAGIDSKSLHIEPDWIFDGHIDNERINAMFKTADDRFRIIVDYIPYDNTGYNSSDIFYFRTDFKVEFLGKEVFTGDGRPLVDRFIIGDGFYLHPSNNSAVIAYQTENNGHEKTKIYPGKIAWTETNDQDGTVITRGCSAGGQYYSEYIQYEGRFVQEAQVDADIQLEDNYIKAQTLDNGSIKYRNSLRDGTLITGEISKEGLTMLEEEHSLSEIFQQGTIIFSNGLFSFLKPHRYLDKYPYFRKTNNYLGELYNFEVSGNTKVGKYILQEHIMRSSIFGGYTQFGDQCLMTFSEKKWATDMKESGIGSSDLCL